MNDRVRADLQTPSYSEEFAFGLANSRPPCVSVPAGSMGGLFQINLSYLYHKHCVGAILLNPMACE